MIWVCIWITSKHWYILLLHTFPLHYQLLTRIFLESRTGKGHKKGKYVHENLSRHFKLAHKIIQDTETKVWVSTCRSLLAFFLSYTIMFFKHFFRTRNSCGLWVLKCMEHWDGEKFTTEICQVCQNYFIHMKVLVLWLLALSPLYIYFAAGRWRIKASCCEWKKLSPTKELQYVKDALLESTEEKEGVDQHQKPKDALRESTEEKEKLD